MADRERLIKLIYKVECKGEEGFRNCPERKNGGCRSVNKLEVCQVGAIADYLLENGVIVPLCKVGDPVWFLLEDDIPVHCWLLSEGRVTDVSAKGFYVSACDLPEDDVEVFTPWTDVGIEAFFSKDAAEAAQKEREKQLKYMS